MAMNKVSPFAQSLPTIGSGAVDPRSAPAHR
jgi:hypothetical protein